MSYNPTLEQIIAELRPLFNDASASGIKLGDYKSCPLKIIGNNHAALFAGALFNYGAELLSAAERSVEMEKVIRRALSQAEGCWQNHYGENPEGSSVPPHIQAMRDVLTLGAGALNIMTATTWRGGNLERGR